MVNRIRDVRLRNHHLDPTYAEVWVTVVPDSQTATMRIAGRLMGPRCHYASTVEVAYYLQPLPHPLGNVPGLTMRVLIPEPSFWEPQTPFLYHGSVNLLEDQLGAGPFPIQHGLRFLELRRQGLRWNGQPIRVHGTWRREIAEEDALALRPMGINTLLAPVSAAHAGLWDDADRLGFLVVGEVGSEPASLAQALALSGHSCCLAWILPPAWAQQELRPDTPLARLVIGNETLLGVRLSHGPPAPLPKWISFIACAQSAFPSLVDVPRPRLVLAEEGERGGTSIPGAGASPSILGWITP